MKRILLGFMIFWGGFSGVQAEEAGVEIISEKDTSFSGRKRAQIEVYAPIAKNAHDRELVLREFIKHYEKAGFQYTQIFIRPTSDPDYYSSFGMLGSVEYSVDGCGVSGKNCGQDKWKIKTSDYFITDDDQKYMDFYIKNHRAILLDFNRDPDNWSLDKAEELEEKFNKALANDLGVEPDDIPVFMIF